VLILKLITGLLAIALFDAFNTYTVILVMKPTYPNVGIYIACFFIQLFCITGIITVILDYQEQKKKKS